MITIHTQIGPIIVSNKKNRFTSSAGINLGAIVTITKGIATHRIHIKGTIKGLDQQNKTLNEKNCKIATNNLPTTAAGTRFFDLADLIVTAPTASPLRLQNLKCLHKYCLTVRSHNNI